jgi:hypothetical protein
VPTYGGCGLATVPRARGLACEKPVGERVAHLCCAGQTPHPLRATNLAWISVADVSPSECCHDDMHQNEASEKSRIELALSHPPSLPPHDGRFVAALSQNAAESVGPALSVAIGDGYRGGQCTTSESPESATRFESPDGWRERELLLTKGRNPPLSVVGKRHASHAGVRVRNPRIKAIAAVHGPRPTK